MAVTDVDLVVKTIRESRGPRRRARRRSWRSRSRGSRRSCAARGGPRARSTRRPRSTPYCLSERQAKAILEMRLSRLTGLEQEKLATEYGELCEHDRPLPRDPREPQAPRRRHRHGARGDQGQVRRQAPHRDRRERRRDPGRRPHPGRGHGRHDLARRLHQADAARGTTARRSAAAKGASEWRRAKRTG